MEENTENDLTLTPLDVTETVIAATLELLAAKLKEIYGTTYFRGIGLF